MATSILERCDILGAISEEAGRLTRRYGTLALRRAYAVLAGWMHAAGLETRYDSVGNLIGRYPASQPGAKTLLLGSHLDTVRDAGKYDGPLGVLVALAAIERLHAAGRQLPCAVEIVAFADEEGLRYHTAYLGSAALAGSFDMAWLELADDDGVTLAEAIRDFGGNPAAIPAARYQPTELLGYCEVHIEQGPVLEARGLPLGVVSAIAGQRRFALTWRGHAGHAGTVPVAMRHDALCAAAEFVLAAEALAQATPGLLATIGQLVVEPGASNVIPGVAVLSLDVRHQDDAVCEQACASLEATASQIANRRGTALEWQLVQSHSATPCDPRLTALLGSAVASLGLPVLALPSGAGHDGVALATLTPIAMLFVRCAGGISHNPAEAVAAADVALAVEALSAFLELIANERPPTNDERPTTNPYR